MCKKVEVYLPKPRKRLLVKLEELGVELDTQRSRDGHSVEYAIATVPENWVPTPEQVASDPSLNFASRALRGPGAVDFIVPRRSGHSLAVVVRTVGGGDERAAFLSNYVEVDSMFGWDDDDY